MVKIYTIGFQPAERDLTIHHLIASKGMRKFVQVTANTVEDALAAQDEGIDLLAIGYDQRSDEIRRAVPKAFLTFALPFSQYASETELLSGALNAMERGADMVYYSGPTRWIEHLALADVPVIGHVGMVPRKAIWRGGLRPMGKTYEEAVKVWNDVRDLENAGAVAVELELIPAELTEIITKRTSLVTSSIGAGASADIIFQFIEDILGENPALPRHARAYENFYQRAQDLRHLRRTALRAFADDATSGAYPGPKELCSIPPSVLEDFTAFVSVQRA